MTIGMKIKVLIKCGTSETVCRIKRGKSMKLAIICEMLTLVCTEHTSTTSPVDGTQKYDYLHYVKSADHHPSAEFTTSCIWFGLQFRTDLVYRDPTKISKKYQSTCIKRDLNPLLSTPPLLFLLPIIFYPFH